MSQIRIKSIKIKNYRSFGNEEQEFHFPHENCKKPVAIVGYNNAGKTTLVNAIKYGLYESVREETFELKDFYNCEWNNPPYLNLSFKSKGLDDNKITDDVEYTNEVKVHIENEKIKSVSDICNASNFSKKWVIKQNAPIFYINFHKIKEEISTQKTSWGNLKSFLAKHINKLITEDPILKGRKERFINEISDTTERVLVGDATTQEPKSELFKFIDNVKTNYERNLRDSSCVVEFTLPDYEDIFLQMLFKIGLNGNQDKLVPLDHFGDGYISMFVMAVIQAIAESDSGDKCLFLFEEPESFLHENHQEYFYKTVLCGLAKKGHQVIYTTHSHRMVDMFDTQGLIRIEYDDMKCQTVVKYNDSDNLLDLEDFNSFIKSIDPSLNRILFSKKVVLVEGPNDVMTYNYIIKQKVLEKIKDHENILDKDNYAETYLNFKNIAIVPHHGKHTVYSLIKLCKKIKLDYFVITDWDIETVKIDAVMQLESLNGNDIYENLSKYQKAQLTTNFKILKNCQEDKFHFNYPKLEGLIDNGEDFGKDSKLLWDKLKTTTFDHKIFPDSLSKFLEIDQLNMVVEKAERNDDDILPF